MWCFKKSKVIVPGDFSFVSNRTLQFSLEYDYYKCLPLMPGDWRVHACPIHTEHSYQRNLNILTYIHTHGWEKFLENKKLISSFSEPGVQFF